MAGLGRRSFLSLLGAAGLAPALPLPAGAATAASGYNRYMYGLAVFHARTRATVSAADLVAKLRVSSATAEAMLGEMTAKGVITPAMQAAGGVARAIDPHQGGAQGRLRAALRKAADWMREEETDTEAEPEREAKAAPESDLKED
jgi:hypothetical protein